MKSPQKSSRGLFLSSLTAQIPFIICTVVLLLIFCSIANSSDDPLSVAVPLSICARYLSSIVGGFAATKLSSDGVLAGLISGILTASIVFLLSTFPLYSYGFSSLISVLLKLLVIPASVIGAVLGKKKSRAHRSRQRKFAKQ